MIVEQDRVVRFRYRLHDEADQLLEESSDKEPVVYLHGHRNIIRGLEAGMVGKQAGERFSITVEPVDGYGPYRPDQQQRIPVKHLLNKGRLKPGMVASIQTEQGVRQGTIIKVGKFNVDVDTNHPFAGKTLRFDVEIIDVREAGSEEVGHGHAHGPGGHHHH